MKQRALMLSVAALLVTTVLAAPQGGRADDQTVVVDTDVGYAHNVSAITSEQVTLTNYGFATEVIAIVPQARMCSEASTRLVQTHRWSADTRSTSNYKRQPLTMGAGSGGFGDMRCSEPPMLA